MTPAFPTILAQESLKKYFFFSIGASKQAADTESLFMYILWVNIISFVMLMALLAWFVLKYHRSKQTTNYQVSAAHHTPLELTWSIVPLLIMIPIFYWGFTGYADKLAAPSDSEEINVRGQKWDWSFYYRNGAEPQGDPVYLTELGKTMKKGRPEIVVPLHRPVKLIMSSRDVIHAFYIPDFRTKMDVIPNRYTSMWFYPEKLTDMTPDLVTGKPKNPPHQIFCAEYCGQDHSEMAAQLKIVTQEEYEKTIKKWTDYKPTLTVLEVGKLVYDRRGCNSCHTIDGKKSTGPTWKDLYLEEHNYTNGEKHVVDENWLRENILYSQKRILKDTNGAPYPTSMPIFAGQLNDLEMDGLVLYIKSLAQSRIKPEELKPGDKTVQQVRDEEKAKKSGAPAPAPKP